MKGRFPILLLGGVVLGVAGAARPEGPGGADAALPLLAEMCAACHGPDGRSPGSIPALAPLDEEAMRAFLLAYRTGGLEATVMDRIARALTDEEIEALSRHFGTRAE